MKLKAVLASASLALAAASGSAHAATNLIVDGGFENAGFVGIAGFTMSGHLGDIFAASSQGGYLPEEGDFFAALGATPDLNFLSQTFSDVAGETLQISYYLASDGAAPNEFQTLFDGATLSDIVDVPNSNHLYNQVIFDVTATGTDTLTFGSMDGPNYLALDNISVTPLVAAAPEPSAWLLMVAGVGLIGASLRRRRAITGLAPSV